MLVCCLYCLIGRDVLAHALPDCRDLQISLPKPQGKNAKANQQLSAQQQATCSFIMKRGGATQSLCPELADTREFNAHPGGGHQRGAMTSASAHNLDLMSR